MASPEMKKEPAEPLSCGPNLPIAIEPLSWTDGRTASDPVLLKALCRADEWRTWLEQAEAVSIQELASKAGVTPGYVQKVIPLAFLAPGLTRELLNGGRRLHSGLMAHLNRGIPIDWDQQLTSF
jgi:site-specific DNA recombinase